jgi:hypothetical protein
MKTELKWRSYDSKETEG